LLFSGISEQDKDSKSTVTIKGFLLSLSEQEFLSMQIKKDEHEIRGDIGVKGGIFMSENWNQLRIA
jgi:hypothetical protein